MAPIKSFSLFVCLILYQLMCAQKLPDNINEQPDGITIAYFDFTNRENLVSRQVFIGNDLKFKFPAYNDYTRIDISQQTEEIKSIQKYLTFQLLDRIEKCCDRKNCPDTVKGYFLQIKNQGKIEFEYLDINYLTKEKCGSDPLEKIINSFQKL